MMIERAARAGLWSVIDIGLRQAVQFGVSVALARLLMPAEFGIIALLTFFSSFAMVFIQSGLSLALVQRQDTTHEEESAVFWINLIASSLVALLLLPLGPFIADFYGYPVLQPLMFVAAAQLVFSALAAVQTALLTRALRFAGLAVAGVVSTLLAGLIGIVAAVQHYGVWALAAQMLVAAGVNTVMLWWVSDWRPLLRFRLAVVRPLIGFGGWISLSSALETVYTQGFALLVGKLHGADDLGLYNRAASTQLLPINVLSSIIGRIALPLFAARAREPEAIQRALRRSLRLAMFINVPMMVGLALVSDLVVLVLFGEKWAPAAPILAILAWSGAIFPMHVLNLQALLALGCSGTYFRVEIAKKSVGIAGIAMASFYGIFGLAYGQAILAIIALFMNVKPIHKRLGYGVGQQLADLFGIFAAAAVMGALIMVAKPLLDLDPALKLALLVGGGTLCFFLCAVLFKLKALTEAIGMGRLALARKSV